MVQSKIVCRVIFLASLLFTHIQLLSFEYDSSYTEHDTSSGHEYTGSHEYNSYSDPRVIKYLESQHKKDIKAKKQKKINKQSAPTTNKEQQTTLEIPDENKEEQKTKKETKISIPQQIFKNLTNITKPLSKDFQKLIALSLKTVLKQILLQLFHVYSYPLITTAPLDVLKAKIESLSNSIARKKNSVQGNLQLIQSMNTFLRNNQRYIFTDSMLSQLSHAEATAQETTLILQKIVSKSPQQSGIVSTESFFTTITKKIDTIVDAPTSTSLPQKVYEPGGILPELIDTWKKFKSKTEAQNKENKTLAASIVFTSILKLTTHVTTYIMQLDPIDLWSSTAWNSLDVKNVQEYPSLFSNQQAL